jgi:hypothetical protein
MTQSILGLPRRFPLAFPHRRRCSLQMLKSRGKSLRSRPSFAGTGLLERMRSTTFALLGIMAAMALGLVALVSSQGLPVLPGLPVPGLSSEQSRVDDARAVAAPRPAPSPGSASAAPVAQRGASSGEAEAEPSDSSGLTGSRQLATAQDPVPVDPGVPEAPGEEAPVAPTPAAPPAAEAPVVSTPSESSPEPPAAAGTPPGKAAAAVDPTAEEEDPSGQSRAEEAAKKRSSRGGRGNGKAAPAPVAPPAQVQDDAAVEADAGAQGDEADVAEPSPPQAQIAEDEARPSGRGHGSRRSRR